MVDMSNILYVIYYAFAIIIQSKKKSHYLRYRLVNVTRQQPNEKRITKKQTLYYIMLNYENRLKLSCN